MSRDKRIVVLGAGPAGLGAGFRLRELGHEDWEIYEAGPRAGGLSASFTDDEGFTWDLGGHVHFSHYDYYDRALREALGEDGLNTHVRNSFIHILGTFVRYPFQNHLKDLPPKHALRCLLGIAQANYAKAPPPANFREWMNTVFGRGIVELFMEPYNLKVWDHPLEEMSFSWIGERVSVLGLKDALQSVLADDKGEGWGPNFIFGYPRDGGTGLLFDSFAGMAGSRLRTGKRAVSVDPEEGIVGFEDGTETRYDGLVSTIPAPGLVSMIEAAPGHVQRAAGGLVSAGCTVVGVGVRGSPPPGRHWVYFPEDPFPFYRVTHLSNYSDAVVPKEGGPFFSFLCEIPFSPGRGPSGRDIEERTVDGLLASGLLSTRDAQNIVTVAKRDIPLAYPVPTLDRDERLRAIMDYLEPLGILSRGRFGGFRYEVGNMDHSFMQGVQAVNRLLLGDGEDVYGR